MKNPEFDNDTVQSKKILYIGLFFVNLLVIVLFWWKGSGTLFSSILAGGVLLALGRLSGLLAEFFILVQLVLVGRITVLNQVFPYDVMNKVHRYIGTFIGIAFLSHPVLIVLAYAKAGNTTFGEQMAVLLSSSGHLLAAFFGLIIFIIALILSIRYVRKHVRYETWYVAHLGIYVGIGLALGHQFALGGDMGNRAFLAYWYVINYGVFGLVLLYRVLRPIYLSLKHRFVVERVEREGEVTHVYITGKDMENFTFKAGQFANINFLQKRLWTTHPFSFSQAYNGKSIRFSMKDLGDYTSRLPELRPGTRVIIDGPHGLFVAGRAEKKKLLFIAGGIGITPIRALIEEVQGKDAVLLYANRDMSIPFKEELRTLASPSLKQYYIVEGMTEGDFLSGRIDKEKLQALVPDLLEREAYLCGPVSMMEAMQGYLKDLGLSKKQIHFEKFSY